MKNPIKNCLEFDEKIWKTQGVKNWEIQRAKGKWHFVLKIGLFWSLLTITGFTLFEYLLDGRIRVETLPFKVLLFIGLGFVFGLIVWRNGEKKYQKEKSEKKSDGFLVNDALINRGLKSRKF